MKNTDTDTQQDASLARKLGFGILTVLVVSLCAWFVSGSQSCPSSPQQNATLQNMEKRISLLEKRVFSSTTNTIALADTGSGPVGQFNNPILDDPAFPPESDDMVLPIEEEVTYGPQQHPSSEKTPPPKEIALELSALFDQELALSSMPQQQSVDNNTSAQQSGGGTTTPPPQSPQKKQELKTYTVQKGDTLSKISLKFYGTSKKWKKILDANKDKLGPQQVLRAGVVLVIPEDT